FGHGLAGRAGNVAAQCTHNWPPASCRAARRLRGNYGAGAIVVGLRPPSNQHDTYMIEADELRALCQRIIQSGELGRSRTYAAILEYLAEQAITGSSPKEVSIAMDVLGRDSD